MTDKKKMRSMGTLKIQKEDADQFLEALNAYGFEKSAIFLRRCAKALMKHHAASDELAQPLGFKVVPKEKQRGDPESEIVRLSGKSKRHSKPQNSHTE